MKNKKKREEAENEVENDEIASLCESPTISREMSKNNKKKKSLEVGNEVEKAEVASLPEIPTSLQGMKKKNKKKREVTENEVEESEDASLSKNPQSPQENKKNRKKKREEAENEDKAGFSSIPANPMERRKKRREMDKEKHQTESNNMPSRTRVLVQSSEHQMSVVSNPPLLSNIPGFHISVFRDLSLADTMAREAATEALVKELCEVQKAHEKCIKEGSSEDDLQLEAAKDDGLNNCAPSLRYALRRLIRGVSSSRECARQGFALGLTIVIASIPSIKVDSLLKLIDELLEVSSSMKGQEVRDCYLGRLFAYGALARSGRIAGEWTSDKKSKSIMEFINSVVSLANKKRYLREPAASIIVDLANKLPAQALSTHVLEASLLKEWFQRATDDGNPDVLLLAMKLQETLSGDDETFSKLWPCPFSPKNLFTIEALTSLVSCFKETTFCQPRVHSLWPYLVDILFSDLERHEEEVLDIQSITSSKKSKKNRKRNSPEKDLIKRLRSFCEVVIEGALLSSSHDRKHLAFDVLLLVMPRLPSSCIHAVLSKKLIHCLVDILSTKDSWLYKAAQHFLHEISSLVENDDDRRIAVVVALQQHTDGKFDIIARTNTVKDLVSKFGMDPGCTPFVGSLISLFLDEGASGSATNQNLEGLAEDDDDSLTSSYSLRNWIVDCLYRISKNSKLLTVRKEALKFLTLQGLFSASLGTEVTSFELHEKLKWPKSATSSHIRRICMEQLQLLLGDIQKDEGSEFESAGKEPSEPGEYFMWLLETVRNIPSVSLFRTLSDEDEGALKKMHSMHAKMLCMEKENKKEKEKEEEKEKEGKGNKDKLFSIRCKLDKLFAMRFLLIQLLLQVLLHPGEFSDAASELVICCKKAFADYNDPGFSEEEEDIDVDGSPVLMDVLVDTLLSLLPHSSGPLCFAVERVFKAFCDEIAEPNLLSMLRVIKKDLKPSRHQVADSDDDEEEDVLGIEETEDNDEAEESGEDGESNAEMRNEDLNDADDDDGVAFGKANDATQDPEGSDDSDGGMDDAAMFRMDSYLALIFKEKKNMAGGGGDTTQSQLMLFKLRVLSLLEIFLQKHAGKPIILTAYSYLIRVVFNLSRMGGSVQLTQRISGILQRRIFKQKDYPKGDGVQIKTLENHLEKSLSSASRSKQEPVTSLSQNATFWLLKIVRANFTETQLQRTIEIFQTSLEDFFTNKKSRFKSGFFKEVFRREPWLVRMLFGFLLEKCRNTKSEFRRVEALSLVDDMLKLWVSGKAEVILSELSFFKGHLSSVCDLIQQLLSKPPEKASRRSEVRQFCIGALKVVSKLKLNKSFIKALKPDAYAACESHFGDVFKEVVQ
ncbi:myb-binding protein 1A-like protein [Amborella trichopoda]|uniref:DNA polymerase V n=1 Tax=Amborella trichopoda TaxID=13333 RepID=U5D7A0_AMBTC|nr:myb-binding protein 1A-like protein [Amborella trichopoda]XP_020530581.1 myb-binding protein 1A-like protein [Amborella trichopoda]ERN18095.1 hypothetical protein AMTR_s00046p00229090 [Amborella trichopoda]|eukprot:XP_020530580.1 myb-binding protein 1A-like protein [Amborella trichopoda]